MIETPTKQDCTKFKIALLLLPIIPSIILYFKGHINIAVYLISVFWSVLIVLLFANLIGKNIDKPAYKFFHGILRFIGTVLSTIALFFTWIFTIFPTGVMAKIRKRDRLSLNKKDVKSYWKDVEEKESSYENQY